MPRQTFIEILQDPTARISCRSKSENLIQTVGGHSRRDTGIGENSFDFGREDKCILVNRIEQRLNAEAVPEQIERFVAPVPDGKGKNAV